MIDYQHFPQTVKTIDATFVLFDLKKIIFLEKNSDIYIHYFGLKLYCNKKYYVHHNSIRLHTHSKLPEVRNRKILLNVLYQESQINLISPSTAIIILFCILSDDIA